MRKFFYISMMLLSSCFMACGGDDDNGMSNVDSKQAQNQKDIIGKWVCKYYAPRYQSYREVTRHDTLSFNADGTYRKAYEQVNTPLNGTYTVNDLLLTLDGIRTYDLSFSKDTMFLGEYGYGSDNNTYKYIRLK